MELVTVTTVSDAGLANVVVGVLEQAGVEAVVGGAGAPDVYPMPSVHPFRILVNEERPVPGARRPCPVRDHAATTRRTTTDPEPALPASAIMCLLAAFFRPCGAFLTRE